ncbi:hypothetical protein J6590_067333 [Homalodisca vitripennis]|nr:hypothetical protein J6590_067333 [Homalodisca vitripennis]
MRSSFVGCWSRNAETVSEVMVVPDVIPEPGSSPSYSNVRTSQDGDRKVVISPAIHCAVRSWSVNVIPGLGMSQRSFLQVRRRVRGQSRAPSHLQVRRRDRGQSRAPSYLQVRRRVRGQSRAPSYLQVRQAADIGAWVLKPGRVKSSREEVRESEGVRACFKIYAVVAPLN